MNDFNQIIEKILETDNRFTKEAYIFIKELTEHINRKLNKPTYGRNRGISIKEYLDGFKDFTKKKYGGLSKLVLNKMKIFKFTDIGEIIIILDEYNIIKRQQSDNMEDFEKMDFSFQTYFEDFMKLKINENKLKKLPKIDSF